MQKKFVSNYICLKCSFLHRSVCFKVKFAIVTILGSLFTNNSVQSINSFIAMLSKPAVLVRLFYTHFQNAIAYTVGNVSFWLIFKYVPIEKIAECSSRMTTPFTKGYTLKHSHSNTHNHTPADVMNIL